MSRERNLIKNTGILMLGTMLPKLAAFIVLPILTGYLTKEEYGTFDLITILVALLLPIATLQLQTAAFRFLIDVRDNTEKQSVIVSTLFAFAIPVSLVALIILYFVLQDISPTIRLLICLYFFMETIVNICRQCIRGFGRNGLYSISAILGAVIQLSLAGLLVAGMGLGLLGAVLMLTAAETTAFLFLFFSAKLYKYLSFKAISKEQLIACMKYSWPMVPNYVAMELMRVSSRFVILFFMGASANAAFAVAYKIPQILSLMQNSFSMAWQENASQALKDKDHNAYYSGTFQALLKLLIGSFSLLIAATPLLFAVLIRGDYDESYYQIAPLIGSMFFYSLATYLGGIYVALMKTTSVGITTICAAAINIVFSVLLIPRIGITGASVAMLLSFILLFLFRLFDLRKLGTVITLNGKVMLIGFVVICLQIALCYQRVLIFNIINVAIAIPFALVLNKDAVAKIFSSLKRKLGRRA